jgi:tetratricopeptide (TPR) repeat protein
MGSSGQSIASTAPSKQSWTRRAFYAASLLIVAAALLYTVIGSRRSAPSQFSSQAPIPLLIQQAPTLSDAAETALSRAQDLVRQGDINQALSLFASVGKNAGNPSLQAEAVLTAATVLEFRTERTDEAAAMFAYFLRHFPGQRGVDSARYHLALWELKRARPASAQTLLTAILRDTPESPVASSAAYLAAEAAQVLAQRESAPNLRVGAVVADLLPSQQGPLGAVGLSIIIAVLSTFLSHRDKLRQGRPMTVLLVLLLAALSAYNVIINQQSRAKQNRVLAETAYQRESR